MSVIQFPLDSPSSTAPLSPQTAAGNLSFVTECISAVAALVRGFASDAEEETRASFAHRTDGPDDAPFGVLRRRFGLDVQETQALALALASQVDPGVRRALLQARPGQSGPVTVGMALELLGGSGAPDYRLRRVFLPDSPLLEQRLLVLTGGGPLNSRGLVVPGPTLRYLMGEPGLPMGLERFARLDTPDTDLFSVIVEPARLETARKLVVHHSDYRQRLRHWGVEQVVCHGRAMTLLFSGAPGTGKTMTARALATTAKRPLLTLAAGDLPAVGVDEALGDAFAEAELRGAILLIDEAESLFGTDAAACAVALQTLERYEGIAILATTHPDALDPALERRIVYHLPLDPPDVAQRRQIWEVHLGPGVPLAAGVDTAELAMRYDFTGGEIKAAVLMAIGLSAADGSPTLEPAHLLAGCRSQLRSPLDDLTVRPPHRLTRQDLILDTETARAVDDVIAACRNQARVLNAWGFGRRLACGRGITLLLDGAPGTGKTLTAEVVAAELDRPLHRINLPEVVSLRAGETEQQIRTLFRRARQCDAVLLFEEAESLFAAEASGPNGGRRLALEVNLLLQELERFDGVAILTTSSFGALDKALLRRVSFRVTLPEPASAERLGIWRSLCPPEAPLGGDVDFLDLASVYEMTGASIKSALLRAAYRAADEETLITHIGLDAACRDACASEGKLVRFFDLSQP
jgi:SpoVK/Ycf46/Vps4 family AAA+-type ATPase